MKEETKYRMIEYTKNCLNTNYCYSKAIISKKLFVNHLRLTIIKIGISCQVTVVFQMSGFIQFTDMKRFLIFWIFFEVKTDTVVVQVARQLTIIQVIDTFLFNGMVYQISFSKEVVVRKHHCALSL